MGSSTRWMLSGVPVLVVAALAVAAGCTAPSIGVEPSTTSNDTSGSDDDDDDNGTSSKSSTSESSTPAVQQQSAPLDAVSSSDAGGQADAAVPCTESGAVQFQGHCYFALTTAASWDDSKAACAATGAHLATLTSAAEESLVGALDPTDERWIGLSRPPGSAATDASYVWVTSEPRSFADWDAAKSEPDGSCPTCTNGVVADCARVLTNGEWADDSCAVLHPALCERE